MLLVLYSADSKINIPVLWTMWPWDNPIWQLFDKNGNTPGCAILGTSAFLGPYH